MLVCHGGETDFKCRQGPLVGEMFCIDPLVPVARFPTSRRNAGHLKRWHTHRGSARGSGTHRKRQSLSGNAKFLGSSDTRAKFAADQVRSLFARLNKRSPACYHCDLPVGCSRGVVPCSSSGRNRPDVTALDLRKDFGLG